MFYPDYIIDEVRQRNDIVDLISGYTQLTKRGSSYVGLCPFHKEKTPSFSVSAEGQFFHCFGCGVGGNVISFLMQKENYDFPEALKALAERARMTLPESGGGREFKEQQDRRAALIDMHIKAARFFYESLNSPQGVLALNYLDKRGVTQAARKRFGLGFAEGRGKLAAFLQGEGYDRDLLISSGLLLDDQKGGLRDRFFNRLMFPIFDIRGKVIAFGGRILDDGQPKYLNSSETPIFSKSRNLYGLNYAKSSNSGDMVLVEGYMDVIALHQRGFSSAVASLGTAFNQNHAEQLARYSRSKSVVLLFDSDAAGEKAALSAIKVLGDAGLRVRVLQLQGAKDPDEYLKNFGSEKFMEALNNALPSVTFRFNCIRKLYDTEKPEGKSGFVTEAVKVLAELPGMIDREIYAKELSELADISLDTINAELGRIAPINAEQAASNTAEIPYRNPYRNKPSLYMTDRLGKKYDEARRAVLNAIVNRPGDAASIRACVEAEELVAAPYIKLYKLLEDGAPIATADILSRFEDLEEQNAVSNVLVTNTDYEDDELYKKALNQQISQLKEGYAQDQMNKLAMEREKPGQTPDMERELDEKAVYLASELKKYREMVSNNYRWLQ